MELLSPQMSETLARNGEGREGGSHGGGLQKSSSRNNRVDRFDEGLDRDGDLDGATRIRELELFSERKSKVDGLIPVFGELNSHGRLVCGGE